jgi:AraC-like DNA-binding protein
MSQMLPAVETDVEYQSFYRSELAWTGIFELPPMQARDRHEHDFWEFIYVFNGAGQVIVGHDQFQAETGDMFIYPPHVEHIEYAGRETPLSMKVLSILNTSDMDFMNFWPMGDPAYVKISGSWLCDAFARILGRILDELSQMDIAYTVRIKALSFEFLSYLVKYVEQSNETAVPNHQHVHVIKTKQYIEEHFSQNIKLTDIAAETYVSMYYLSHLFKEYTGYSPMNYLSSLRISKAQDLLAYSEYSISEISTIVGYDDLQHFSNAFKKRTGLSPRAYRNRLQGEKSENA